MGARGPTHFVLTVKGTEELAARTYRLDVRVRNILFLIQKGTPTVDAILQNSIFPREEVVEKLRGLLKEQFVALGSNTPAAPGAVETPTRPAVVGLATRPRTIALDTLGAQTFARTAPPTFPVLDSGVSLSQARFVLCDFCLDQFGMNGQPLIDAVNGAGDVAELQHALDSITTEIRKHCRDQLPALMARVREINQSGI